jgi:hypothetical protein
MRHPQTMKWEDLLMRQLQDREFASEYLQASWEEEELIGLHRGISDVMRAYHIPDDPKVDVLENLEQLVALGLDTRIIAQLQAEVLRPLPRSA